MAPVRKKAPARKALPKKTPVDVAPVGKNKCDKIMEYLVGRLDQLKSQELYFQSPMPEEGNQTPMFYEEKLFLKNKIWELEQQISVIKMIIDSD